MVQVAIFTALTSISAFVSIPIGPVPITMQSIVVVLAGIILGPKLGPLSQLVYVGLGLIGLPIFSGFTGGVQSLLKPSFGFTIGFIFAAFVVGKLAQIKKDLQKKQILIAILLGNITIYLFGLPYMYFILNIITKQNLTFHNIIYTGFLVFLPGDIIKFVISSILAIKMLKTPIISIGNAYRRL